jgi:hypothetical protein
VRDRPRILIADDDKVVVELLRAVLEDEGWETLVAMDGKKEKGLRNDRVSGEDQKGSSEIIQDMGMKSIASLAMITKINWLLVGLVALCITITPILFSCRPKAPESISPDKYVFIEHHIHTHGEVIEGDYRGAIIDSPTYSFDEKTGTLRGIINFDVNEALKAVYGNGSSLTGVGGGKNTMLYGVDELPYQEGELTILSVDLEGMVKLSYQGVPITLKSGEEWVDTTSKNDVQQYGTVNLTITDRITNYGILYKSQIEKW